MEITISETKRRHAEARRALKYRHADETRALETVQFRELQDAERYNQLPAAVRVSDWLGHLASTGHGKPTDEDCTRFSVQTRIKLADVLAARDGGRP